MWKNLSLRDKRYLVCFQAIPLLSYVSLKVGLFSIYIHCIDKIWYYAFYLTRALKISTALMFWVLALVVLSLNTDVSENTVLIFSPEVAAPTSFTKIVVALMNNGYICQWPQSIVCNNLRTDVTGLDWSIYRDYFVSHKVSASGGRNDTKRRRQTSMLWAVFEPTVPTLQVHETYSCAH